MTAEELQEIKERCNKATEGPWAWGQIGEKINGYVVGIAIHEDETFHSGYLDENKIDEDGDFVEDVLRFSYIGEHEASTCNYGDPDFISHARTDEPKLVTEVERLRGTLMEIHAECDMHKKAIPIPIIKRMVKEALEK